MRPFASGNQLWQVSNGGGARPYWRADGQEIVYVSVDQQMMSATVRAGATFAAGTPQRLFSLAHLVPQPFSRTPYSMTADARRFLVGTTVREAVSAPITVVVNWTSAFKGT